MPRIIPFRIGCNPLLPVGDLLHGPQYEGGRDSIVEQIKAIDLLFHHIRAS